MVGADTSRSNSHHVTAERLDLSFEKSGTLHGSAEVTIKAEDEDMRVARFQLFPTLRVSGVYDEAGQPLDFVQEAKNEDPQFGVILRQPARAGSTVRLLVKYAGPDALLHDGQGTYYLQPAAREQWYPSGNNGLGDFADFHMTFHLPRGLQIVATGKQLSTQSEPSGGTQAVWASETPISVAGFNLGAFHSKETRTPAGFEISAYANENLPDSFVNLANQGVGTLSTASALKYELAQGSAAVQIYSDYFGKLPYDHVALTQQSACSFGQSWPMLVYLPICAFWDKTVQHSFGLLDTDASYWDEVTPHEVSHQWWGQLVGFNSYRDQWMSEGFANYSVSVYLRKTSSKLDPYRSFWQEQLNNLTRKNENGLRPVDVGPLTMGYRVNNSKTGGFVAQRLIYSKGAYILHMLEMMYWTPGQGEQPFRNALQQFVQEYSGKAASTEDFKASLEKTMPKWLDLRGDGKLDWFFNEYVYGTEVPHYEVASAFTTEADGTTTAHLRVVQSGVSSNFVMLLPLYLQLQDGTVTRIANLRVSGDSTLVRSFHMSKLASQPKRLLLNYNADVLSD